MPLTRRRLLHLSGAAVFRSLGSESLATSAGAAPPEPLPPPIAELKPMTEGVSPISLDEHKTRLARAQKLMTEEDLDAIVLASGTSLAYFTGAEWGISERFFGAVLTREGEPAWVTPAFERARALEQIRIGRDVRAWEEHESPYALVAEILRDRKAAGRIGIEETMPFVFADGMGHALPAGRLASAIPVTAGCRVIKDAHEIALMRRACEITLRAHRAVFASLKEGITQAEASRLFCFEQRSPADAASLERRASRTDGPIGPAKSASTLGCAMMESRFVK